MDIIHSHKHLFKQIWLVLAIKMFFIILYYSCVCCVGSFSMYEKVPSSLKPLIPTMSRTTELISDRVVTV